MCFILFCFWKTLERLSILFSYSSCSLVAYKGKSYVFLVNFCSKLPIKLWNSKKKIKKNAYYSDLQA